MKRFTRDLTEGIAGTAIGAAFLMARPAVPRPPRARGAGLAALEKENPVLLPGGDVGREQRQALDEVLRKAPQPVGPVPVEKMREGFAAFMGSFPVPAGVRSGAGGAGRAARARGRAGGGRPARDDLVFPRRRRVGFIGAGRLTQFMSRHLPSAGHRRPRIARSHMTGLGYQHLRRGSRKGSAS
jgi:hypothetical protein